MRRKKNIGQLISITFTDREDPIAGFIVDYNEDWTLMKYNPVDYIIDGYMIFRHINIEGFQRLANERFKERVIKLKGLEPTDKDIIPLTDLSTILRYLTDNFGLFQLYTKSERVCYVGRLKTIDRKKLVIDSISTKGKWDGHMHFKTDDIRVIEFDTDYINSLKLILKSESAEIQ